ncbi:acetate--CoA ligase [Pyrodictium abyssi]|uniref:Acetate--CoA ligase n=1 Tax=Pyrodictium abyssi TaxID=54256 RepID=A0ABM8IU42_9CREN|nr:acetate--CoA ligase [Pyrodictium abyssi]
MEAVALPEAELIEQQKRIVEESLRDPQGFWEKVARELYWARRWDTTLDDSDPPFYRWFVGGVTNITYNILERNIERGLGNKAALVWRGGEGEERVIRYSDLLREVNRYAAMLRSLGVKRGDRVVVYMPIVPEAMYTMLAVARLGAVHVVVFSGFGSAALAQRIRDSGARVVVTADGMTRRGKVIPLKPVVDEAAAEAGGVEKVVVHRVAGNEVEMKPGRDVWAHEELEKLPRRVRLDHVMVRSEEPLFILYTSGTTGKPKGMVHLHGQYMVWAYAHTRWLFGFLDNDVFFVPVDIGWINGHTYATYGPLLNGSTVVWYSDAPDYPGPWVWWDIVDSYSVDMMWVAPTAVRLLIRYGDEVPRRYSLETLRLIVSAGEILGLEPWRWLVENVCRRRPGCHVVETWGQTENSGFITAPGGYGLVGGIAYRRGSVGLPYPGIDLRVLRDDGSEAAPGEKGHIVVKAPVPPAFAYGVWGDRERYIKTYWSLFPGYYYTGDYGYVDEDGYVYILGRADDVVKVAGHRLGPAEIENTVLEHPSVAEAAVVGVPDELRGTVLAVFVVPRMDVQVDRARLAEEVRGLVRKKYGPIAVLKGVYVVDKLPKTRTGKILRRVLRAVLTGAPLGDLSTLEDEAGVEEVRRAVEEFRAAMDRAVAG